MIYGKPMLKKKEYCLNFEKVDLKLHVTKRYTDNSSAFVPSASGDCCYKTTPF